MTRVLFVFFFIETLLAFPLWAQRTVGVLSYDPDLSFPGYNLLYPLNQPNVYLLDNCGRIVHVWEDEADFRPGVTAYLLPDGKLVKTKRPSFFAADPIWAGGGGATVEIRDWDNNLLWSFTQNDSLRRLHHDVQVLPNGNILMISWELKTQDEAIAAGRDPALLNEEVLWPDYILEVDPLTDSIVWEWHAWDHLIQDYDSTKANYGVVEDHPELIDVNWDTNDGKADWMHVNFIDYNEEYDQIMISVPTFNEFWVIDHSTTKAEAAGHTGGLAGRGGDLLYRWGNPATYRRGTATDQKLFFQHDTHWIDDFIDPDAPLYGKVALFNNRAGANFSTAHVLSLPFDPVSWTYPMEGLTWGPSSFDVTLMYPDDSTRMYSNIVSSVQVLPNGNFLVCVGRWGYSFEITPQQQIVWEYVTPLANGQPVNQGDSLHINQNLTFNIKRYPADYAAFQGKDLSPKGYIELNPDTTFCDQLLPTTELGVFTALKLYPNPTTDLLVLEWLDEASSGIVAIYDILGREMLRWHSREGRRKYVDVSGWLSGVYLVKVDGYVAHKVLVY